MNAKNATTKRFAAIAVCAVVAIAIIATVSLGRGSDASDAEKEATPSQTQTEEPDASTADDTSGEDSEVTLNLPFALKGVKVTDTTIEATADAEAAELSDEWTFGGDYSLIGSIPIDSTTVFGSSTDNPSTLTSYCAALIRQDGSSSALEEFGQFGDTYYEPQDGSAHSGKVVWRGSTLNSSAQLGIDNWCLKMWDETTGSTRFLGSAEKVNLTSETPLLNGDTVPTFNESAAYIASNCLIDDVWTPSILEYAFDTDDTQGPVYIKAGNYPAAISDGVLFATHSDDFDEDDGLYDEVWSYTSTTGSANQGILFSIDSSDDSWSVSGIWASDSYTVVAVSSTKDEGTYLGIWSGQFEEFVTWVKTSSPSVWGSVNNQWLVWGAGSQEANAQMYALRLSDCKLTLLGECAGYSRPQISAESNTVLIPHYQDAYSAVSFSVGVLS